MNRYIGTSLINNYLRGAGFIVLWLIVTAFATDEQLHFNSEKLKQVFGMLPDECKREIHNKFSSNPGSYFLDAALNGNNAKLVIRINKYKELDHLGLYLINDSLDTSSIRDVFDYLEREFLVSALLGEKYPLTREIKNNGLEVLYNGSSLTNQNNLFVAPKIIIGKDTPFRIRYDSKFFLIEWIIDQSNKLEIKIPNIYSVITEKTKDELELDLLRKFEDYGEADIFTKRPLKSQLKFCEANIYLFEGEIYSTIPELSSNKYFVVQAVIYFKISFQHR
jgi:hypothetical protein